MKTLFTCKIALATAVLAGFVSAAHADTSFLKPDVTFSVWNTAMRANGASPLFGSVLQVQQAYGQRCVTSVGWCPIDPQPVGSPCRCGDVEGTTLQ